MLSTEGLFHNRDGLFIPAHVNRSVYSLISQPGFVPAGINADALEISRHVGRKEVLEGIPLNEPTVIGYMKEMIGENISRMEGQL